MYNKQAEFYFATKMLDKLVKGLPTILDQYRKKYLHRMLYSDFTSDRLGCIHIYFGLRSNIVTLTVIFNDHLGIGLDGSPQGYTTEFDLHEEKPFDESKLAFREILERLRTTWLTRNNEADFRLFMITNLIRVEKEHMDCKDKRLFINGFALNDICKIHRASKMVNRTKLGNQFRLIENIPALEMTSETFSLLDIEYYRNEEQTDA